MQDQNDLPNLYLIHTSHYRNKEVQQKLLNTSSFLNFQEQHDQNLITGHKIAFLNYIGSSKEIC